MSGLTTNLKINFFKPDLVCDFSVCIQNLPDWSCKDHSHYIMSFISLHYFKKWCYIETSANGNTCLQTIACEPARSLLNVDTMHAAQFILKHKWWVFKDPHSLTVLNCLPIFLASVVTCDFSCSTVAEI